MGKQTKKKKWGGARKGSGPKSQFKDPVKLLVTFERYHVTFLGKLSKKLDLGGKGPAIRKIIDLHMEKAKKR